MTKKDKKPLDQIKPEPIMRELQRRRAIGHLRTRRELQCWLDGYSFAHSFELILSSDEIAALGI